MRGGDGGEDELERGVGGEAAQHGGDVQAAAERRVGQTRRV